MILTKHEPWGTCKATLVQLVLKSSGQVVRAAETQCEVERFLRAHPDQDYVLRQMDGVPTSTFLEREGRHYGVEHGDLVCGPVKWDSQKGAVVCGGGTKP